VRPTLRRCYELLDLTSRSFAAVIQQLDEELREAVAVFYLVLRGLDTIEDDMTLPVERKTALLLSFYATTAQAGWTFSGSGPNEKDRQLLVEYDIVVAEYLRLAAPFQATIADVTRRMGAGMVEFLERRGVDTCAEWDQYCHYVAGLVGIGLSRLFAQSGLEAAEVGEREALANSMGLFLQKTNIIRDYLEDLEDGRIFWPRQVWQRYARELADLRKPAQRAAALACLNDLITDALRHVPDVFTYMTALRNPSVFRFCAIPQVMAVATLAACYNNPKVYAGVVKIRRGEAADMILRARSMDALAGIFDVHLAGMAAHFGASMAAPYYDTAVALQRIRTACHLPPDPHVDAVLVQGTNSDGKLVPVHHAAAPRRGRGRLVLSVTVVAAAFAAAAAVCVLVTRTPTSQLPLFLRPVHESLWATWHARPGAAPAPTA
jgi:farnesyl-diphosphate farnesyltransferase